MTKQLPRKISASQEMPWIKVCDHAPYFEEEGGDSFTPIGQNDAITWPDFQGLFRRKDPDVVDGHLGYLAAHGVNCIRLMMEYCQTDNRYLEKPVGTFQHNMVMFWDDLFLLLEKHKIRVLITPFDTFWMAKRWKVHPYNKLSGGPCSSKGQWLKSEKMLSAVKNRFDFFIERWGGNGTVFGWDLWNEISPVHAGRNMEQLVGYIEEISRHIRKKETELYKKSHLQTVSVFAPLLVLYDMTAAIFRHPMLDFATTHFYDAKSIDNPKNVFSAALVTGKMVKDGLAETPAGRPFLDSEHGPITYFKKHRHGLPEPFDATYFLHMQWAHLASGAAGGGMRWPYRHPHVLTHKMREAHLNLSQFAKLIDWQNFRRINLNDMLHVNVPSVHAFGCGNDHQAIVWLLRGKVREQKNTGSTNSSSTIRLSVPNLTVGTYSVVFWNTISGFQHSVLIEKKTGKLEIEFDIPESNLALAIRNTGSKAMS